MYTGDEKIINNGVETPYSMLGFWQFALSTITESMTRGTFAEYIVKCALEQSGYKYNSGEKVGLEQFDLYGPKIPSTGSKSRIEVKCTGYYRTESVAGVLPSRSQIFSISPKISPDETGDYPHGSAPTRNNDVYVFVVHTSKSPDDNVLDMSFWDFYVIPTHRFNNDEELQNRKSISLKTIQSMCERQSFDTLVNAIIDACSTIF